MSSDQHSRKREIICPEQYEIFHDLFTDGHDLSLRFVTMPLTMGSRPTSQQGIKILVHTSNIYMSTLISCLSVNFQEKITCMMTEINSEIS